MAAAANAQTKALNYIQDGEKALKRWFGGSAKYEDAAEAFKKAATQFKIAKDWEKAGQFYMRSAEASMQAKDNLEATSSYQEAARAYKHENSAAAAECYVKAVHMLMEDNRLGSAGKLYKEMGEMYESEHQPAEAIEAFNNAADCFGGDNSPSSRDQCMLRVAQLVAEGEEYKKAIEIYEDVARASADDRLRKWSVKEYYFKALLCHMALSAKSGNMSSTQDASDRYKDLFPEFDRSRECTLIDQCIDAWNSGDVDRFTDVVFEFDNITKLDDWKAKMLLEVKQALKSAPARDIEDSEFPDLG